MNILDLKRSAAGWTYQDSGGRDRGTTAVAPVVAKPKIGAANPKGVPSWMDVYQKHQASTNNFGGKGVNSWKQDATHEETKRRFDQEYLDNLAAYNKANGTDYKPQEGVLGVDAQPNEDWHSPDDNVDQKGGVMGAALGKDWVGKAAAIGALAVGGWAAAPYLAGGAAGTAGAASGLAGAVGMNAGLAATALNTGALHTVAGLTVGKQNIGDALKGGAAAAALSGVGGWAAQGTTKALTSTVGANAAKAIGTVAGGATTGGLGAAVRGKDVGKGIISGAVAGGINAAADVAGNLASDVAGKSAGSVAKAVTGTALRGGNVADALTNVAVNLGAKEVGKWTGAELAPIAEPIGATIAMVLMRGGGEKEIRQALMGLAKSGAVKTASKAITGTRA